jgi:hypothetical protein
MQYVDHAVAAATKNITLEVVVGRLIKMWALVKRNGVLGMVPNPEVVARKYLLPAKPEPSTDGAVASIMDSNPLSSSNKVRTEV